MTPEREALIRRVYQMAGLDRADFERRAVIQAIESKPVGIHSMDAVGSMDAVAEVFTYVQDSRDEGAVRHWRITCDGVILDTWIERIGLG